MTLHPASMAERAVESTQHSATTPEMTRCRAFFCGFYNLGDGKGGIDTFGEYRVCFYPWKEFRHHFIEPWIRVYSRINFIIFFPDTVRVFCSQILGKMTCLFFDCLIDGGWRQMHVQCLYRPIPVLLYKHSACQ
mgnify:CR=1 FL=1